MTTLKIHLRNGVYLSPFKWQLCLGISKLDAKNLYLAYHEGHSGYQRKSYLQKPGLLQLAEKVAKRAKLFQSQLAECKNDLENKSWFF